MPNDTVPVEQAGSELFRRGMIAGFKEIGVAFDSGSGSRAISHDKERNPHSRADQPELHAAWLRGWERTDAEANRHDG